MSGLAEYKILRCSLLLCYFYYFSSIPSTPWQRSPELALITANGDILIGNSEFNLRPTECPSG